MGSKPDGLFRLHERAGNQFDCDHLTTLPDCNVYSITNDKQRRLWIATLGGGVCVCEDPQAALPSFRKPSGYPKDGTSQRVRYLHITNNGYLMAATTDGLVVAKLENDADKMLFRRHYREPERANSLSSSATMDILEDGHGRIYVSTESGGINLIESTDLESEHLAFRHINVSNHQLPSDVTLSLTNMGDGDIMVVGNHYIGLIDNAEHVRVLDAHFFNDEYRFSEAHPQHLDNGKWLFGLNKGAFTIAAAEMQKCPGRDGSGIRRRDSGPDRRGEGGSGHCRRNKEHSGNRPADQARDHGLCFDDLECGSTGTRGAGGHL